MKQFKILLIICVILGLLLPAVSLKGQEGQEKGNEDNEMMTKWKAYATPGDFHKYLEYFVGTWEGDSKMWMKPGEPTMKSKHISKAEMIMGGRYLKSVINGDTPWGPFEGMSLTGYDNAKKKFMSTWLDNTGTGFYPSEGDLDETKKIRTEKGEWYEPMTGGTTKIRIVTTIIDKDKFTMVMYTSGAMYGPIEMKAMETIYTRKK